MTYKVNPTRFAITKLYLSEVGLQSVIKNKSNMHYIKKWQELLNLQDQVIKTQEIHPDQVVYADDVPKKDRYYIGVNTSNEGYHTIYYDRPMIEEDVVHEMLHVKFPVLSQDEVNELTTILLK